MSDNTEPTVANTESVAEPQKTQNTTTTTVKKIYVGPNVCKYGLFTNQVYSGGLPINVIKLSNNNPLILQLFAPLDQIADYQTAVQTKGTPQYLAAQKIQEA